MNSPSQNPVNCWKTLRAKDATTWLATTNVKAEKSLDWAISSQASLKKEEGSTIRDSIRIGKIPKSAGLFACSFIPARNMMSFGVIRSIGDFQIFRSIVSLDPVYMMGNFMWFKKSTKFSFQNKPMDSNISFHICKRMIGLSDLQISVVSKDVARVEFIGNENIFFSSQLANVIGCKSQLLSDFNCRKTIPGQTPNLFNGSHTLSSGDSEFFHPAKNVWLAQTIFASDLAARLSFIILLQLILCKWRFNSRCHKSNYRTNVFQLSSKKMI